MFGFFAFGIHRKLTLISSAELTSHGEGRAGEGGLITGREKSLRKKWLIITSFALTVVCEYSRFSLLLAAKDIC